ncbi:hypothetical protein FQN51_008204 [Onygenales sp. PD_10]|nr:hypothetical protein FQN51_008204 [Onygenales sp. PD_10]
MDVTAGLHSATPASTAYPLPEILRTGGLGSEMDVKGIRAVTEAEEIRSRYAFSL